MEGSAVGELFSVVTAVVESGPVSTRVIRVWIVGNQPVFQRVLATALAQSKDFRLTGHFVHPEDALQCNRGADGPEVLLMDVQEFGSGGIQAVRQFRTAFPVALLIIITESREETVISDAICAGASGYLLKDSPVEKILESIREVVSGGALLAPAITRSVLEMFRRLSGAREAFGLTGRELSILNLMGRGLVTKEIAQQLAISYHTVDTHSRNIYTKLGVHSRVGAVAKGLRERII